MTWTMAVAAAAGEPVAPGDVLLVSVAEDPRLGRDAAKVGADGLVQLPLLGGIEAAGSDVNAIARRISEALKQRGMIRAPTVLVEIAAYRPFYIGGAVANPGAIAFEPGLTVRHAIILAGGLGKTADSALTVPEVVELRTKWRTTSLQIVEVESRIARLSAELARQPSADFSAVDARLAATADAKSIVSLDTDMLSDRDTQWTLENAHLQDALAMVDFEIGVLDKQADLQAGEIELQGDQVAKSRQLREKGLIPLSQLQDLEREKSRLSRDMLDTQAYPARARQAKASAQYDLESADAKRRIEVRRELRAALMDRSRINAEAEVVSAALADAGLSLSDATVEPVITLHRRQAAGDVTLDATLETAILPGDLIEVSVREPAGG